MGAIPMVVLGRGNMPTIEAMSKMQPEATTTSIEVEQPMIFSLSIDADTGEQVKAEACRIVSAVYGIDRDFVSFGEFLDVQTEEYHVSVYVEG